MANTTCFRVAGKTVALSVSNSSHTAVTITPNGNDRCNFASFLNTGTTTVAVTVDPTSAPTAVLPVDGTPQNCILLPPSMTTPAVYAVPADSFSVAAIGSASGPSIVYITPVGDQS